MTVMIFVILFEVFVEGRFLAYFVLQSSNDQLYRFVSPHELFMLIVRSLIAFVVFKPTNVEPKFFDMPAKLNIGDTSIEIFIESWHKVIDLRNSDGEAHTLEQVVELFNIDVVVLVDVDFIKYILQRQTSLFEYLDNVVENLVLSVFLLTL